MDNKNQKYTPQLDEISLKDVILKAHEYLGYFWSKKWYLLIILAVFVSFFIYRAKTTPWIYYGETKFFLEGNNETSVGGLGGLLGQLGGGGADASNPFRIIEVAESKLQLTEILFEKIGPDSIFIANKVMEVYDLQDQWAEDNPKYEGFEFTHDSIETFSYVENLALARLIRRLIDNSEEKALMIHQIEEDKGYYYIMVRTIDSNLTYRLSEVAYQKLKHFFEVKTLAQLKKARDVLEMKSDSIKSLLDLKIQQLADFKDRNRAIVYNIAQIKEITLESEIQGLNAAYMEVVRNFEMADFKFRDKKNYFMLIDRPRMPLGLIMKNWKVEAIKGGILALFLSFGFLFLRKSYRDIMNS